ncbi:lytic transglycosylase domain-containing protein [Kiloniella laminariae]|uniref:Lytic transglycosylase domain-containing protein n=1 Tax=Kiloniella laminariae TaxID=454162 RepID=A0ABT4LL29_9PROT|nr:lytic transglycosylase domain-containing protein [Kiloniella laminariae]MCZ4281815.1 lytic transglycosylase domain-containing protein [Kiloniella laminariae]
MTKFALWQPTILATTLTLSLVFTGSCGLSSWSAQASTPVPEQIAPLADQDEALKPGELPKILKEDDIETYARIFALQEQGRWPEAKKQIAKLQDMTLMGHVLAQKYLHPTAYRSKYKELKEWLDEYADHPQADTIYKLALQRRPKNYAMPAKPVKYKNASYRAYGKNYSYRSGKKLSGADQKKARQLKSQLRRNILNTRLSITEEALQSPKAKHLLDKVEIDQTYAKLAAAWYYYGKDQKAYDLAEKATKSRKYVPSSDWIAGLAAWRMGQIDLARKHFSTLADATRANSWMRSAGAYWTARANLKLKAPQDVSKRLYQAAEYPRTFYGVLARRALGLDLIFENSAIALGLDTVGILESYPTSRRALALLQLDKIDEAREELSQVIGSIEGDEIHAFLELTEQIGMPRLAFRLGARMAAEEKQERQLPSDSWGIIDTALYPIPQWEPTGGYEIDRALVYAFMRQESSFNPNAKSPDGARGLLQLMPQTATFIADKRSFRGADRNELYDPSLNLELGQKYLSYLLTHSYVQGDLFKLATAYNGGPGNLGKWERNTNHNDDPLLFIESIPSHETRLFIERVLTNLWIYRARLNQASPSLDALAAGHWPRYEAQDINTTSTGSDIANNAKAR